MPTDPERLKKYLVSETADTRWVSDKLVTLLSGEAIIPPFSAAAIKLGQITRDENCQMEEVGEVINMDPGLASDVIRVASSVGFAARRIASVDHAAEPWNNSSNSSVIKIVPSVIGPRWVLL